VDESDTLNHRVFGVVVDFPFPVWGLHTPPMRVCWLLDTATVLDGLECDGVDKSIPRRCMMSPPHLHSLSATTAIAIPHTVHSAQTRRYQGCPIHKPFSRRLTLSWWTYLAGAAHSSTRSWHPPHSFKVHPHIAASPSSHMYPIALHPSWHIPPLLVRFISSTRCISPRA
jgi:hypothetical protein